MPRTPPVRTTPGDRVRIARNQAGLTQAQLADAAHLHEITVSKIERGRAPLSLRNALKIADVTGISPGLLLADLLAVGGLKRCPHCGELIG